MPGFERRDLYQKAVLWPVSGRDRYSEYTHGSPVNIDVQWTGNPDQKETVDAKGNTVVIDATAAVHQRIAVGSLVWLAPRNDVDSLEQCYGTGTSTGSAALDPELFYVKSYDQSEDIKGRHIARQITLMRYKRKPAP